MMIKVSDLAKEMGESERVVIEILKTYESNKSDNKFKCLGTIDEEEYTRLMEEKAQQEKK